MEEKRGILVLVDQGNNRSFSSWEGEKREIEEVAWSAGWKILAEVESRVKKPFYKDRKSVV